MKKYLYILIPFVKWAVNFFAVMAIFNYVYVTSVNDWVDLAVGLAVSAVVAAPFAYWAFYPRTTTDKQLAWFLVSWVVVTFFSEAILDILTLSRPFDMLLRYEFLVQTLVELAVVLLVSRVVKRHRVYKQIEDIHLET